MRNINISPCISVIVPVYKVESYLERCLVSIVNQSYSNLEILLVDDGSPDSCPRMCDELAGMDGRIKVIHKENGGLSDARNVGIEVATGDYLMFVDSDDYIYPEMCQKLINTAMIENADVVSCNFYWTYPDGERRREAMSIEDAPRILDGQKMLFHYFRRSSIDLCVVWNKLYRRELFFTDDKIRFPKGRLHEDNAINYLLYYKAKRIAIIPDCHYYYVQRDGSIMQSYNDRNMRDIIACAREWLEWSKNKSAELQYLMEFATVGLFFSLEIRTFNEENLDKDKTIIEDFRRYILANVKDMGNNPYFTWKMRLKWRLSLIHCFKSFWRIICFLRGITGKNEK